MPAAGPGVNVPAGKRVFRSLSAAPGRSDRGTRPRGCAARRACRWRARRAARTTPSRSPAPADRSCPSTRYSPGDTSVALVALRQRRRQQRQVERRGAVNRNWSSAPLRINSAGVPAATVDAVVDDDQPVGQFLGLLELVGGQHDGHAVAAQRRRSAPTPPVGRGRPFPRSARRGTPVRAGRRGRTPAPAAAAARRTAAGRWCGRRRSARACPAATAGPADRRRRPPPD